MFLQLSVLNSFGIAGEKQMRGLSSHSSACGKPTMPTFSHIVGFVCVKVKSKRILAVLRKMTIFDH